MSLSALPLYQKYTVHWKRCFTKHITNKNHHPAYQYYFFDPHFEKYFHIIYLYRVNHNEFCRRICIHPSYVNIFEYTGSSYHLISSRTPHFLLIVWIIYIVDCLYVPCLIPKTYNFREKNIFDYFWQQCHLSWISQTISVLMQDGCQKRIASIDMVSNHINHTGCSKNEVKVGRLKSIIIQIFQIDWLLFH